MSDNPVQGVFAAVPTPFAEDYTPDLPLFMEHCDWVIDKGCDGLNVLGSTGEANSQTVEARAGLMRAVAESDLSRAALMVGTGTPALSDTIELTALAAELGFDAALVLPPYYYVPVSDDGLFAWFSRVVDAVKNSNTGIYLYNFPQMTGLEFSPSFIERLLEAFPTHVRGMKDSSGNLEYTNSIAAQFAGHFDVFPGNEAPLADAVEKGYAGCISASVNATAEQAANIWQQRNDPSAAAVTELAELRSTIASVPLVAAVKALTAIRTGHDEWQRLLPPLQALEAGQHATIQAMAERLGFSTQAAAAS